jgi:hypothetical protein
LNYAIQRQTLQNASKKSSLIDESGNVYGELLVLQRALNDKHGNTKWLCECSCGNKQEILAIHLRSNKVKSCGCLQNESKKLEGNLASKRAVYRKYKQNAKQRGKNWDIDENDFYDLTSSVCHYCGESPKMINNYGANGTYYYNGLDRKDNTLGYCVENVVPCCTSCNFLKGKLSYEEFIDLITKIYKNMNLI